MPYMSQKENLTLIIQYDDVSNKPSKENGTFATLHTWEQGLTVGDETSIDYPDIFLMEKVTDREKSEEVILKARNSEFRDISLEYQEGTNQWTLTYFDYHKGDNTIVQFDSSISNSDLEQEIITNMWAFNLYEEASTDYLILPVYLNGGELSAGTVKTSWQNTQVGYIFASHEEIKEKFGDCSPESLRKAEELMIEEAGIHNQCQKGNYSCYLLYEDGEGIEFNFGYVGEIEKIKPEIFADLPEIAKDLVEYLEYVDEKETENFKMGNLQEDEEVR